MTLEGPLMRAAALSESVSSPPLPPPGLHCLRGVEKKKKR
jgi:hypothetical protein